MDMPLVAFLITVAALTSLPAWLTGSILRKSAKEDGGGGSDWMPLGFAVYGFTRFKHPRKGAIVGAYLFSNLLSWGSTLALVVYVLKHRN
ncbi:MAG TPA: hypothetical protein VEN81_02840 [Planctomycetota bacterium]|nr:hypothetical protein [Planctomycetota bacterium]